MREGGSYNAHRTAPRNRGVSRGGSLSQPQVRRGRVPGPGADERGRPSGSIPSSYETWNQTGPPGPPDLTVTPPPAEVVAGARPGHPDRGLRVLLPVRVQRGRYQLPFPGRSPRGASPGPHGPGRGWEQPRPWGARGHQAGTAHTWRARNGPGGKGHRAGPRGLAGTGWGTGQRPGLAGPRRLALISRRLAIYGAV